MYRTARGRYVAHARKIHVRVCARIAIVSIRPRAPCPALILIYRPVVERSTSPPRVCLCRVPNIADKRPRRMRSFFSLFSSPAPSPSLPLCLALRKRILNVGYRVNLFILIWHRSVTEMKLKKNCLMAGDLRAYKISRWFKLLYIITLTQNNVFLYLLKLLIFLYVQHILQIKKDNKRDYYLNSDVVCVKVIYILKHARISLRSENFHIKNVKKPTLAQLKEPRGFIFESTFVREIECNVFLSMNEGH